MHEQGTPGETAAGRHAGSGRGTLLGGGRSSAPRRRATFANDPWAAPLILGLAAGCLRLFAGMPWASLLSIAVMLGATAPMVYRSRHSGGRTRLAWALFAASVAAGSISALLVQWNAHDAFGVARDAADTIAYVCGAIGVVLLARDFDDSDPDAWLDAAAVGVVLSLVVMELVIEPLGTLSLPQRPPFFPLAVAGVDAVVFTTLVRFVIRPVAHLSLSGLAVVVGIVLVLDATYYATATDVIPRPMYEALWMIAYGAWGAGAIHPDTALLARGIPRPRRPVEREISIAYRAVWLYAGAFALGILLLWVDFTRDAGKESAIIAAGLVGLNAVTVARSVRVVRRLSDDSAHRAVAEGRLRESEERFRRLAEGAPVGIFVSDAAGRSVFQNDAWAAAAGTTPGEGLGLGYVERVHPDDRDWAMGVWLECERTGAPMSIEHRLLRPDGSTVWVHARAVPMPGADGRPTGWVGTVSDITELKAATAAAEEREAFFNGLIEQSPIGIGVYGLDGALIGHNDAERRIRGRIGIPLEVPDVRTDALLLRMGQGPAIERAYRAEMATEEPTAVRAVAADAASAAEGERIWLRFRWYPLRGADGGLLAVISFTEDVTGTIEADIRERRVGDKLQESAKLEALGVLAGGIAHDFNNLLVPILGYVDLALTEVPPESTTAEDLQAARTAAARAADLARQMLAYSGRGTFTIGPAVLEDLLGEIGDLLRRSIAKGARLRYEFAPGLPTVLADATQLRQVALNLIVNASDALDGRPGDITLRTAMTTLEPDDPDVVPGSSAEPGEYVMLEVSDSGYGMDAATGARIFDPFFSTKSMGRGLGLAAVLGIVKGHGGAIRVRSTPGEGSRFSVLLRPTGAAGEAASSPSPGSSAAHAATGRVLLVDDEPSVRQIGRRILERAGFTVDEADDGPVAIEQFRDRPDEFDSVLLDLTLPSLDGLAVMRELRAIRPSVPVVLCSGWSADEVAAGLGSAPHTAFLQKPYQMQTLVEALQSVAERAEPSAGE